MPHTETLEVKRLHPSDHKNWLVFEQEQYSVFSDRVQQNLLRQIWLWDDEEKRISLRQKREELGVLVLTLNQVPQFYVAANTVHPVFSQLAYFGFESPAANEIEVFTLFRTKSCKLSPADIQLHFLKRVCYPEAKRAGAQRLLATCAPALLPLYLRWGWQCIETRNLQGEVRHRISLDLTPF